MKGYSWADACNDAITEGEFWLMIGGTDCGRIPPGTVVFASRLLRESWEWIIADELVAACWAADPTGIHNYSKVAALIGGARTVAGFEAHASNGPVRIEVRR